MAQPSSVFQNHRVVACFATRSQAVTCGRYQSTLQSRHALAQFLTIEQLNHPDPPPLRVGRGGLVSVAFDVSVVRENKGRTRYPKGSLWEFPQE